MTRRFRATEADARDRLDVVLARELGESRTRAATRVERGEVTVNGARAVKATRLTAGDEVVVVAADAPGGAPATDAPSPPVRYEDEHLLVVAKPAGLVVHPGAGNPTGTLVQTLVRDGYALAPAGGAERPGVVHRLDRDTSGLLVVAKTDAAYLGLVAALRRRDVERRYTALVEGRLPAARGRLDGPVGRDPDRRRQLAVVADGKPAVTHWEVSAEGVVRTGPGGRVSLVSCRLETGRTHQIRVHLSTFGHPVVGDATYGGWGLAAALGLERPFLHAYRLALTHPVTGEPVRIEEPLPGELRAALEHVRLEPG